MSQRLMIHFPTSGASERANGRASGLVLPSVFLVILAHSEVAKVIDRKSHLIEFAPWIEEEIHGEIVLGSEGGLLLSRRGHRFHEPEAKPMDECIRFVMARDRGSGLGGDERG